MKSRKTAENDGTKVKKPKVRREKKTSFFEVFTMRKRIIFNLTSSTCIKGEQAHNRE